MLVMRQPKIRVVVVDDHPGVRAGLKNLLTYDKNIVVVGEGATGVDALELAKSENPDIMLLDVELPIMRGEEVMRRIKEEQLKVKVLAVSSYNDRLYIQEMLDNGAFGYLTKDEAPEFLVDAIHSIVTEEKGERWVSPKVAKNIRDKKWDKQAFTRREREILNQLAQNKSNSEISSSLGLNEKFIDRHIELLMNKCRVSQPSELIRIARDFLANQ